MSSPPAFSPTSAPLLVAVLAGYLLGALPFGYWVARAKGVNIFEHGSKSPGATNVRRVLGKQAGNRVFLLDACKGAVAGGWPLLLIWKGAPYASTVDLGHAWVAAKLIGVVGLIFALLGHSFSCFTHFKGGKGVATGAGGFVVLMPLVTLIAAAVWALTFFASRYVSLASIFSAVTMPVGAWVFGEPKFLIAMAALVMIFVILRHRGNVVRLVRGTESKWTKRPEASP
jgi:glycerol-3-phosphate acyltransferase PlsY